MDETRPPRRDPVAPADAPARREAMTRPPSREAINWPPRDPDAVADLVHDEPRFVRSAREHVTRTEGRFEPTTCVEPLTIVRADPAGIGVVRELQGPASGESGDQTGAGVRRFAFVSSWTRAHDGPRAPGIRVPVAGDTPAPSSATGTADPPIDPHWGVRLRYRPPTVSPRNARRGTTRPGLLVHLHGLDGHEWERRAHAPAIAAGWGILECTYPLANWQRLTADVADPASVAAAGRDLAWIIDHRFSEIAYAVEACLARLASDGEAAAGPDAPLGMLAFSAGGNAAAAVAARLRQALPGRLRGVIIAAAGGDLMHVSLASSLGDTGLDIVRRGSPVDRRRLAPAETAALRSAYAAASRMDAVVVGPAGEDSGPLATLACGASANEWASTIVLGRFDSIVPPEAGRALAAALPGARVIRLPLGHYGIYLTAGLVARRAVARLVSARRRPN